jgi:hypothetical protein
MHIGYWWESQKGRDCSKRALVIKVFIASSEKSILEVARVSTQNS